MIFKKFPMIKTILLKVIPIIVLILIIALIEQGVGRWALIGVLAFLLGRWTYYVYKHWAFIKGIFYTLYANEKLRKFNKQLERDINARSRTTTVKAKQRP